MGLGIPPIRIKIVLESNPLKPTMLVGGLAVCTGLEEGPAKRTKQEKKAKKARFPAGT